MEGKGSSAQKIKLSFGQSNLPEPGTKISLNFNKSTEEEMDDFGVPKKKSIKLNEGRSQQKKKTISRQSET